MDMQKAAFPALVLFGLLISGPASAQTPKPGWKGKITTENGVKVVLNPAEPLYGEFAFDLKQDLAIGGDPDVEPAYFPKGAVLSVDETGTLYVADFGNLRVQLFDKNGKFIRSLGRQGQGPGEYSYASRVMFDAEGDPCVAGGRDIVVFGRDGIFKRKVGLKAFLSYFILGPGGTIVGSTQPSLGPGGPKYTLVLLGPDGVLLRTLAEERGEFSENQKAVTLHWYGGRFAFAPLAADAFVYGFNAEYRIRIADAEGRTRLVAAKDEKAQAITAKEKDETRKSGAFIWFGNSEKPEDAIVFPDHRPFFSNILTDRAGRFYVVKSGTIFEKDAPRPVDVFSKEGFYLYRMTWPFVPAEVRDGSLYQVREDKETGEYQIVRFRIANWAAMRKD
jgi:hypothetical protein